MMMTNMFQLVLSFGFIEALILPGKGLARYLSQLARSVSSPSPRNCS